MGILRQILATAVISYLCTTMGLMFALPSSVLKLFTSENTPLNRVMTETEVSLMGSLSSISSLLVTPFCGYLLDTLGRKQSLILLYITQLLGWVMIVTTYNVEAFLSAMFLCGPTGCTFLIIPIYISEYCQENIRGTMTSGSLIFLGIGMLVSYLFGGFLDYSTANYVGLSMTALGLAMICFMKESPLFLMKAGREEEAAEAIAFYRGITVDSKEVKQEMENLNRILSVESEPVASPEEEKFDIEDNKPKKKFNVLKFLVRSRSSRRALLVILTLYTAAIFQGIVVIQVYAEPLFEEALPNISATLSSVLFAIVSVVAGFIGAYLIDVIGRRLLLIYASFATGLCCVVLGTQVQLFWGPHWLTAIFIYLYCLTYTVGAGSVPFVMAAEVFLPEVKSFASMISIEWCYICNFIILFIFNPLINALGLGSVFYLFSAISFLTVIFCYMYVPETKGLPVDVIQQKFAQNKYQW